MPAFDLTEVTLLFAQIAAILVVSRLLGLGTRRLGQPLVIGEVLAGIVLGPSLLGWLYPEAMAALFPASSLASLKVLSEVGLVLFMFLIGLELDLKLLRGRTRASVAISHTGIICPFLLGVAAAWWLRDGYASSTVPLSSFMLFLGASMTVTAFPVLARILSERNLLASRVGAIAMACAAANEVSTWCILAFVVAAARAEAVTSALWTTGAAVLYILAMMYVVRPFLARLGARIADRAGLTSQLVAITLVLLIVSSALSELIGIHALFGAFLFGAILPKDGFMAETLADRLETVSCVLLLPLFFAFSGLRTEIGLLTEPTEWLITGMLVVIATLGKFGGCAVAARLSGLPWREASAVGIVMNTRGLVGLIVLNIGMDLGVISTTLFTMLVIMALVTTFITTPVLRWVYPHEALARDRPAEAPAVVGGQRTPFTVLMCVSDEATGPGLAALAAGLAGWREPSTRFVALHLWEPSNRPSVELRRGAAQQPLPLAPLIERARELMLEVRALSFVSSAPALDICRTAQAKQASLVLLGSHKPLLLEGSLGGIVADVIAQASSPVGVFVDRGLRTAERILVAFTGGPEDRAALRVAQRLGTAPGARLTLLHVVAPGNVARRRGGRTFLKEDVQMFDEPDALAEAVCMKVVEHDSPPDAVLDEASRGYDLVVLGMNASWGLGARMISFKRQRVLAESPISVLAIHPPLSAVAEVSRHSQMLPKLADSSIS